MRMEVCVCRGYSLSYCACVGATDYSKGIQTAELQTLCVNQFDMGRHEFLPPSVGYRRQSLEFELQCQWDWVPLSRRTDRLTPITMNPKFQWMFKFVTIVFNCFRFVFALTLRQRRRLNTKSWILVEGLLNYYTNYCTYIKFIKFIH